ncbi:hypothetical protein TSTA_041510 [Talaromyces stipitatus ATCC 10500]|uniref:Uncharacterized protein n=1 Tax=Talaromyces stipitatus (strain ATCC 10500 / CBS 375.48 / QM 6759 / NRRL 1006) TaxID=441959 RepID=B8MJ84_TALSN|nr:uncharacterized protein TSTA_041510 [Talaromyces stipitatus ATCC 10500]EED14673.1 hypothetical protein TSTA_041510 [Talaromyces stipitatus ATCC 10500]
MLATLTFPFKNSLKKYMQISEPSKRTVIAVIEGDNEEARCVAGGIPLRKLDHLTDRTLVPGNPDHYYGACPEQLNRRIRNERDNQIIPTTEDKIPIAPNSFLAVKGPDGLASVVKRQACYDNAFGVRGMHSLQEYGKDEPEFDNHAYTISSIYHDGTSNIFTIHPSKPSDRLEYHMTRLRSFVITDTFRQGVIWYRNARDWVKE